MQITITATYSGHTVIVVESSDGDARVYDPNVLANTLNMDTDTNGKNEDALMIAIGLLRGLGQLLELLGNPQIAVIRDEPEIVIETDATK